MTGRTRLWHTFHVIVNDLARAFAWEGRYRHDHPLWRLNDWAARHWVDAWIAGVSMDEVIDALYPVGALYVSADANWTDLTDGGATTLHSHTGGEDRTHG